jgi:hypothetical protein
MSNLRLLLSDLGEWSRKIPWKGVQAVLLAFIVTRLVIFAAIYLSMSEMITALRTGDIYWRAVPQNILADGLIRWDSRFYIDIAQHGYTAMATAFFPLYPLLVRILYKVVGGHLLVCGLLVSNLMFIVTLAYLYALVHQEYDDEAASRAVFYLAAAPAAFAFSAMYSESVLLAFLIACFYYARNGRWFLAAIMGAAASAARVPGVLAAVFILLEALWRQGIRFFPKPWSWKAQLDLIQKNIHLIPGTWPGILAAAGSTTGLLAYMLYLNITFHDPLSFIHQQTIWSRQLRWDWFARLFTNTFQQLNLGGNFWAGQINVNLLQDVSATLIFLPLVITVMLKMRPSFGAFTFLAFLIPLLSSTVFSMRRLTLTLVPCFILLGVWGRRPWLDRIIVGISLAFQVYLAILFSHWDFAG